MKIKVSEATGPVLDWMVATVLGGQVRTENGVFFNQGDGYEYFTPSSSWEQGGPIIERESLSVIDDYKGHRWCAAFWHEHLNFFDQSLIHGPTPLIAAMRCYVASKLGDIVDVPEELTK